MAFSNRRVLHSILLMFLILVAGGFLYKPEARASQIVRGPILIQSNSDFTAAKGVVGGNGTAGNPYIIDGWKIGYSGSPGIEIQNATAYFVVRNVFLNTTVAVFRNDTNGVFQTSTIDDSKGSSYDTAFLIASSSNILVASNIIVGATALDIESSSGITILGNTIGFAHVWGTFQGITINASRNLIVQDNIVSALQGWGVIVENDDKVQVFRNSLSANGCPSPDWCARTLYVVTSSNVTVTANNVTGITGITASGASHLLVYHNNVRGPSSNSQGSNNQWDNGYPSGGNYWSDYTGLDRCAGPGQNMCPFPDGIGDTPYAVNSIVDRYPLVSPFVPPAAAQTPHPSISIAGNSAFTASNGVRHGSGTDADPFVISDWSVGGDFDSIRVSNTTDFFVVQNVVLGNGFGGIIFSNVTNGRVEQSRSGQYGTAAITIGSSRNVVVAYDWTSAGSGSPHESGGDGIDVLSSTNVVVAGNTFAGAQGDNLLLSGSDNVSVTGNFVNGATNYGMDLQGSTHVTMSGNSFSNSGLWVAGLPQAGASLNISADNLVNGKPLYFYYCHGPGLAVNGIPVGQLIIANCSNVQLSNLQIHGTDSGITLAGVQHALVENVSVSQNEFQGMALSDSSDVTIENSDFSYTPFNAFIGGPSPGMLVTSSNRTRVYGSSFLGEGLGLEMFSSTNTTVEANTFSPYLVALSMYGSTGVHVFHNNFYLSSCTTCLIDNQPGDSWDNGYPSGGNFYSNYAGVDKCSGSQQNVCTGPDGIGDTPYLIPGGSYQDRYPLMKTFNATQAYSITLNKTMSFDGVTVATTGNLLASGGIVSGTVTVGATNSTTSALLYSKTYSISSLPVVNNQALLLLNVAVSPYSLSAAVTLSQTGRVWSSAEFVTRNMDFLGRGLVDINDISIVFAGYGSSIGMSNYNPNADLLGLGAVNVVDASIVAAFYGAPEYS